jgi:hypothetical protein
MLEHPFSPQKQGRRSARLDQHPYERLIVAARTAGGAGIEG